MSVFVAKFTNFLHFVTLDAMMQPFNIAPYLLRMMSALKVRVPLEVFGAIHRFDPELLEA